MVTDVNGGELDGEIIAVYKVVAGDDLYIAGEYDVVVDGQAAAAVEYTIEADGTVVADDQSIQTQHRGAHHDRAVGSDGSPEGAQESLADPV